MPRGPAAAAGTGYPADGNIHEVVQRAAPGCVVVYADSDPVVMTHAIAWLAPAAAGGCGYVEADLIVAGAARTLDLGRPAAVLLVGVLHFIADRDDPGQIIARLMGAVPAGSFLVISHFTADFNPRLAFFGQHGVPAPGPVVLRTRQQIVQLFTDWNCSSPGWCQHPGGGLAPTTRPARLPPRGPASPAQRDLSSRREHRHSNHGITLARRRQPADRRNVSRQTLISDLPNIYSCDLSRFRSSERADRPCNAPFWARGPGLATYDGRRTSENAVTPTTNGSRHLSAGRDERGSGRQDC